MIKWNQEQELFAFPVSCFWHFALRIIENKEY